MYLFTPSYLHIPNRYLSLLVREPIPAHEKDYIRSVNLFKVDVEKLSDTQSNISEVDQVRMILVLQSLCEYKREFLSGTCNLLNEE